MDLNEFLESKGFDPTTKYSDSELEELTNELLRTHARSIDPGTKKERGIGGDAPILFEEHIYSRKKREIYNINGVPDPEIVQGIYNRVHPQGRKVNSPEARKSNGASFYR